jgi:alcohol dehydrogenase (cytochrome c)
MMAPRYTAVLTAAAIIVGPHAFGQALFAGEELRRGDAAAGQAVYRQSCAVCHGPVLEGSPFGPTLTGQAFVGRWRGRPAQELLSQMERTMPPKGTGTVEPEAFPDLLAFMLRVNRDGPAVVSWQPAQSGSVPVAREQAQPRLSAEQARLLSSLSPVTEQMLATPPEGDWLTGRRSFDATGFSPLRQIDRGNVQHLQQAWRLPLEQSTNEITPLVHDGVLFVYSGNWLQAVDAASGNPLWRYRHGGAAATGTRQFDAGARSRVRSIAIHGHAVYMPTPDGHLVALDARSGRLLWDRAIGSSGTGLQLTSGPLVARGVVMIGVSLGLTNKGGCFIVGVDAATGEERWRIHTVARAGARDGDSWNGAPTDERFGAGVWTAGSYDPELNLAYFGVGNTYTTATLLRPRPGAAGVTANDGLYTNSTLALRPETGELVWHYQHHQRDVWDQDWAFEQTLITLGSGASATRAVVTGGKTGVFDAVDAATGRFLFSQDTGLTNLFLGIDPATGAKRANPALEPVAGKPMLLCPSNLGSRNWLATSFDAATGTLFVPMLESCAEFVYEPRTPRETANGGSDIRFSSRPRPAGDGNFGRLMALDLATRQVRWTHRQRVPLASSVLATAGGVLFIADLARNFSAHDQGSGKVLWQTRLPAAAESTPITYTAQGRQYVALVSGEGSHLGVSNRGLVPELGNPRTDLALLVFALPRQGVSPIAPAR